MSLDPRNHNWEKGLEEGLPDCRVRPIDRHDKRIRIGQLEWDIVYCANCHKPQGAVTPNSPHVYFICDDCVAVNGEPPGAVRISD